MVVTLERWAKTKDGVLGRMGRWYTLEEEDAQNRPGVSAIPAGTYTCKRRMYHKGGYETFEVTNVPGRSDILIHIGNTEEDTMGCILLGMELGTLVVHPEEGGPAKAKIAVLSSGVAFRAFMASMQGEDSFTLDIVEK